MGVEVGPKAVSCTTEAPRSRDRIVFVGTGVSTGIPVIGHLDGDCACAHAIAEPNGPNRRNNVSLMVQVASTGGTVLIDVGKTFRDSYFRTLQPRRVGKVDAIFLTHDHADAIGGLDDIRDLQHFQVNDDKTFTCRDPMPVFLSKVTLGTLSKSVDYIIQQSKVDGDAHEHPTLADASEVVLTRRVACLKLRVVDDMSIRPMVLPAKLSSVPFVTFPVFHGGSYRSMGYCFGGGSVATSDQQDKKACVVYISDVSAFPDESMQYLRSLTRPIDILVVDMLLLDEDHFSHYSVDNAWNLIVDLQPRRAFGVGMYCKIEHDKTNAMLAKRLADVREARAAEGKPFRVEAVELAFDGLELDVDL